ncbi:MAG: acyl-CoA dehydrogenase family protein [Deltaproteobacteria bacterium]|nr:acyl-CoA dehydrogenase family protein [Deltaproteobacteria bacterium]
MEIQPENDFTRLFGQFAAENIATRPDLSRSADFPANLWEKMAEAGLLGVGIDPAYGGLGGGAARIQDAGRALVSKGRCLGLALSWLIHSAVSCYVIGRLGSEDQKARLLPLLAKGGLSASIAMSEPGVGAHPKHLSTKAEAVPGGFEISGRKAYLTNGPIAGLFIVLAVTGETDGKKEFSAFLVPRDSPGLAVEAAMSLEILRPAPHCGITLDKVRVPPSSLLGPQGAGYGRIIKPFRVVEDVLLMGPVMGGLLALARNLAASIRETCPPDESKAEEDFGRFVSMTGALSAVADKAAELLDRDDDENALTALCVAFRAMARDLFAYLESIKSESAARYDENLETLALDMAASSRIAANVTALKQKKLGRLFLARPENQ